VHSPFDSDCPPIEPSPRVRQSLLWRLAVRLYREHRAEIQCPTLRPPQCRVCGREWPCEGRRLAERGLVVALSESSRQPVE